MKDENYDEEQLTKIINLAIKHDTRLPEDTIWYNDYETLVQRLNIFVQDRKNEAQKELLIKLKKIYEELDNDYRLDPYTKIDLIGDEFK